MSTTAGAYPDKLSTVRSLSLPQGRTKWYPNRHMNSHITMGNLKLSKEALVWIVVAIGIVIGIWALVSAPSEEWGTHSPVATSTPATATSTTAEAPAKATVPQKTGSVTATQPTKTVPAKVAGYNSASYLISLKEPLVCTVDVSMTYTKRTGTIYVDSGKLRGNFSSYVNGVLTKTAMIDDGASLYAWTNGATTGLKLPASSSASGSAIASHGGIDLTTPFSFACAAWTPDAAYFQAPTAVTFSNTY